MGAKSSLIYERKVELYIITFTPGVETPGMKEVKPVP
jgi:hypothetical protein